MYLAANATFCLNWINEVALTLPNQRRRTLEIKKVA
jgi:hypothetical protein